MKDDFPCFGSGLDGYVHYMDAFNQIFENARAQEGNCDGDSSDTKSEDYEMFENDSDIDFPNDDSSDREDF